jgi:hypothetical protein
MSPASISAADIFFHAFTFRRRFSLMPPLPRLLRQLRFIIDMPLTLSPRCADTRLATPPEGQLPPFLSRDFRRQPGYRHFRR